MKMKIIILFFVFSLNIINALEKQLEYRILEPTHLGKSEQTLVVLIVCGIHAREFTTIDICKNIVDRHEKVKYVIVDVMNPDGVEIARSKDECWRGNANKVDLNRNFPHPFRNYTRSQRLTYEEEYAGKNALSEWESRSLISITQQYKPSVLLTIHSGDIAVLIPYDGYHDRYPSLAKHKRIASNALNSKCSQCKIGSSIRLIGYESIGTISDYASKELDVEYVFTLET